MSSKPFVYLTCPYTVKNPPKIGALEPAEVAHRMRHIRFIGATFATSALIKLKKWNVFSPITHSHPLHTFAALRGDWEFWKRIDTEYIEHSHTLVNLTIPGWEDSTGVKEENEIAKRLNTNILFMTMPEHLVGGHVRFYLTASPELRDQCFEIYDPELSRAIENVRHTNTGAAYAAFGY